MLIGVNNIIQPWMHEIECLIDLAELILMGKAAKKKSQWSENRNSDWTIYKNAFYCFLIKTKSNTLLKAFNYLKTCARIKHIKKIKKPENNLWRSMCLSWMHSINWRLFHGVGDLLGSWGFWAESKRCSFEGFSGWALMLFFRLRFCFFALASTPAIVNFRVDSECLLDSAIMINPTTQTVGV